MKKNEELWKKVVEFHGHECPGLTIGYRAALYAAELLDLTFSDNEEVVCVSENDACGVDAIQVILGCSVGKGNLLFHMTGKQAFNFYNRTTGKKLRLVLTNEMADMERAERFDYFHTCPEEEMFIIKEAILDLPEPAQIFQSFVCENCGETVGANWVRMLGNKHVCIDCSCKYDRFRV